MDVVHSGHHPLLNTSQYTLFRAIIQSESDDTVASSMNSDTSEKFDREDCACAVHQERFSASVQTAPHSDVKSRLGRPVPSNTSCVRVARMMISVRLTLHEHQSLRDRLESNSSCAGWRPQTVRLNVQFNPQSLNIPSLTSEVCSSCDVGTPKNTLQTGCFFKLSRHHRRCSLQRPCTALYREFNLCVENDLGNELPFLRQLNLIHAD